MSVAVAGPAVRPRSPELTKLLERIAAGAAERERTGSPPWEPVRWLREARFGAFRVPIEEGGGGASVRELFATLIDLSHADSNVGHLLRAHFGATEDLLLLPEPARSAWVRRLVAGDLIGNGNNERGELDAGDPRRATTLVREGDGYRLDGTKAYSTGTLFAQWTVVTALLDGAPAVAIVPTDRAGVTVEDDWDGFGQRLTATGTTRLEGVRLSADEVVVPPADPDRPRWHLGPFYQHWLNAVIAGNLRTIRDDAVALLRDRRRGFSHGNGELPRHDPVLLEAVGRIAADALAAEAVVLQAAEALDRIPGSAVDGLPDDEVVHEAALRASAAQGIVNELGLRSATRLFDVGGASATRVGRNLDRHWRNVRTIASHNPDRLKHQAIGDLLVNDARLPDNTYF